MNLWVKQNGTVIGPISSEKVIEALNTGRIRADAQISDNRTSWHPATALLKLNTPAPAAEAAPPAPAAEAAPPAPAVVEQPQPPQQFAPQPGYVPQQGYMSPQQGIGFQQGYMPPQQGYMPPQQGYMPPPQPGYPQEQSVYAPLQPNYAPFPSGYAQPNSTQMSAYARSRAYDDSNENNNVSNGLAICALVFSIVLGLVGLILSIVGLTKYNKGTSGRVMCIIAVWVSLANMILGLLMFSA